MKVTAILGKFLLSPNLAVDTETTLVLFKLIDLIVSSWGTKNWGVEQKITRSMSLNAVGLYLNSLAENEVLDLYLEHSSNGLIGEGSMG